MPNQSFIDVLSAQLGIPIWAIMVLLIWSLTWKALALWKSARKNQKLWFIAILLINTLGFLEILYLFLFSQIKLGKASVKKARSKRQV